MVDDHLGIETRAVGLVADHNRAPVLLHQYRLIGFKPRHRIKHDDHGIGHPDHDSTLLDCLPLDRVAVGIDAVKGQLRDDDAGLAAAAEALRTTDSVTKIATTSITLPADDGEPVPITVTGIAKGEFPASAYFGQWRTFPDTCDWSWPETKPLGVDRTYKVDGATDGRVTVFEPR